MKIEKRNNKVYICGYVNAVERLSKPLRDSSGASFLEKVKTNVFKRAIENAENIRVLLNHDDKKELANTRDGSAELYEDNIGLHASVEISDPELIEEAENGELKGWSFGFICNRASEKVNEDGILERTLEDIDLLEVSILNKLKTPAYIATSVEVRDNEDSKLEIRETANRKLLGFTNEELIYEDSNKNLITTSYSLKSDLEITDVDEKYLYFKYGEETIKYPYEVISEEIVKTPQATEEEETKEQEDTEQEENTKDEERTLDEYIKKLNKIKEK